MRYIKSLFLSLCLVFSIAAKARSIHFITLTTVDGWEEIIDLCKKSNTPLFVALAESKKSLNDLGAFEDNNKQSIKKINQHFVSVFIPDYTDLGKTLTSLFLSGIQSTYMIFNPFEELLVKSNNQHYTSL